jgi:hypothetical protein
MTKLFRSYLWVNENFYFEWKPLEISNNKHICHLQPEHSGRTWSSKTLKFMFVHKRDGDFVKERETLEFCFKTKGQNECFFKDFFSSY